MAKNLVIVESPAKAKTIEKFLGPGYEVKSSFGHVRDLTKKGLGVDVERGYLPEYEIPGDKQKVIKDLKKAAKDAELVWLASDEDREGEAISWHLSEALKLKKDKTRRIVFHEITRSAIEKAVNNPRSINMDLVNAQQARRVLDRLVGFELSPLLWKKVKPALSAGRVQSVAVRLIVEREKEVKDFVPKSSFRVTGNFFSLSQENPTVFKAEYQTRFSNADETKKFLTDIKDKDFSVVAIEKKPAKRSPAPPFTTSTLQQEASRKLGFSVAKTMLVAQQLYENGKITYMRTDSLNLSNSAMAKSKEVIDKLYGEKYVKTRKYKTKTKGAQEAHEAIRPTYIENQNIQGDTSQKRLYDLIWKRTLASQMADAELEKTEIDISVKGKDKKFIAKGEVIKFEGFIKVYTESVDDEIENGNDHDRLPQLKIDEPLSYKEIHAEQRFTQHPPRYSEASLVKKLEELGIGRPSTYAPTISTIQKREYVVKDDKQGLIRTLTAFNLKNGEISHIDKKEKSGYEKNKLFPTDLGIIVNDFLIKYFDDILDYHFTAQVEKEFDEIAEGKTEWNKMIKEFHAKFHKKIEDTSEKAERFSGEKFLGVDPKTGKKVFVKVGRYGPMAQIGEVDVDETLKFAGLQKDQSISTITLEEALELFKFPRDIGTFEDKSLSVAIGRFGPYVKHDNKFFSLPKGEDPETITQENAIEIILEKRERDRKKLIKTFNDDPDLVILNGRFGPYISYKGNNYKIPKTEKPEKLSLKDCEKIISAQSETKKRKMGTRRKKK